MSIILVQHKLLCLSYLYSVVAFLLSSLQQWACVSVSNVCTHTYTGCAPRLPLCNVCTHTYTGCAPRLPLCNVCTHTYTGCAPRLPLCNVCTHTYTGCAPRLPLWFPQRERGCKDMIIVASQLIEKSFVHDNHLHVLFVDLRKAYNGMALLVFPERLCGQCSASLVCRRKCWRFFSPCMRKSLQSCECLEHLQSKIAPLHQGYHTCTLPWSWMHGVLCASVLK